MDNLWEAIDTLARESGGGVIPPETLAAQGIRGIAIFLEDGSVAVIRCGGESDD